MPPGLDGVRRRAPRRRQPCLPCRPAAVVEGGVYRPAGTAADHPRRTAAEAGVAARPRRTVAKAAVADRTAGDRMAGDRRRTVAKAAVPDRMAADRRRTL